MKNTRTKFWVKCRRVSDGYMWLQTATYADLFFLDIDENIQIVELEKIKEG